MWGDKNKKKKRIDLLHRELKLLALQAFCFLFLLSFLLAQYLKTKIINF